MLAEDQQVNHGDDAEAEEEGVALKVAELEEAQDEARAPCQPAQTAHQHAVNDPLSNKRAMVASKSCVPAISAA